MKKRLSVLLASAFTAILALVMAVPAYAASGDNTITIKSETSGHTFEAYQIFAGDYAEVDDVATLSNVKWGDGVTDGDALLTALKDDATIGSYFADDATAADVAETLATATVADSQTKAFEDNAANIDAFANVVSKFLSATHTDSGDPTGTAPNLTYTISNVADGYYFVKDKDNSLDGSEANAYTKFMLQVVHSVTVDAKADVPTINKTTGDPVNLEVVDLTGNNASIGDKIPYKVTSTVPDMDGYEKYFFVVTDTMQSGLTFNNDVKITLGEQDLTAGEDYTVTVSEDGHSFEIVFKNFIQYKAQKDAKIVIAYSATLNQDAIIGSAGNENKVYLTYSNNPNTDYKGEPDNPDKPGPDEPTGTTPESKTYTYTTGINLFKVDENTKALTGAKFSISGTRVKTVLVNSEIFKKDAGGDYWRLKDGTYTTEAPTITGDQTDNSDAYESTTQKYTKVTEVTQQNVSEPVELEGWVDESGHITFDGLAAGTYTITEMVAPDGYNLLDGPIEIQIDWKAPEELGQACTWTVNPVGSNDLGDKATVENGVVKITVQNERGSLLPSTGGMGTTMFYVVGGVLVAGAAVAYVVKRRMDANNA